MISAEAEVTVAFHEVDSMKVVWHGNYVRYLESGRNALLEKIGFGYEAMESSGYAWPVVDLKIRYARSARLGQRLRVAATLTEWENRLRMEFRIEDAATGELLTRAESVQVAVDMRDGSLQFATPEAFLARLREARD